MADLLFTGWRKWGALISILIVLGVPPLLILKAWHESSNFPVIKVGIAGFDPRDLLRGHYLLFQVDWNWADGQPDSECLYRSDCYLCVGEGSDNPEVRIVSKAQATAQACPMKIAGVLQDGERFDIGYSQYYISETRAREVETLLREHPERFRIGLSLRPGGKAAIEKMYYDGTVLETYLRGTRPQTFKE